MAPLPARVINALVFAVHQVDAFIAGPPPVARRENTLNVEFIGDIISEIPLDPLSAPHQR